MGSLVGIDVGGTFTDLAFSRDGVHVDSIVKVPSRREDPAQGVLDALRAAELHGSHLSAILHGTTLATNAVIERTGARCALIATAGFRDVIELGRRDRPNLYGLTGVQEPLIPREDRWEVRERIDYTGAVIEPLDEGEVRTLGAHFRDSGIGVVVVALLHSYSNPKHEERVAEILAEVVPGIRVVTSSSVVSEYYEFERTSTAVVQGYLEPLVARYAESLDRLLVESGFDQDVLVMQSNGGVVPLDRLSSRAAHIIRSGPAAGVIAAARLAAEVGFTKIITGDMGGTSFDVAVVIDSQPEIAGITHLDFRVPLRIPMIDVHTIGAGGGSIAWIDRGGVLQVGPRSAGSTPGPICIRRGGTEPTVTDANVVLGRINASRPIGDDTSLALDVEGARAALGLIGDQLGTTPEGAAEAVVAVVNTRMAGRMRLISVERGHDPRDFALIAFGGAGPVHCAALMRDVGVRTMVVPRYPGVLCAMGCIVADLRYDFSQTLERRVDQLAPGELASAFEQQRLRGEEALAADDVAILRVDVSYYAEMAYLGQVHRLRVLVEPDMGREELVSAFLRRYEQAFGTTLGDVPVLVVVARTSVSGIRQDDLVLAEPADPISAADPHSSRPVYFDGAWHDTDIYLREELTPGMHLVGPAIIEQADTTTVVEPGMSLSVDRRTNLLVEVMS